MIANLARVWCNARSGMFTRLHRDRSRALPIQPCQVAEPSPTRSRVAVWDWPVRVVHWVIVLLLVGLIITGKLGADWLVWHMRFGQAMLALVVFRVIWGFVGSRNARFTRVPLRASRTCVRYARSLFRYARGPRRRTTRSAAGWSCCC